MNMSVLSVPGIVGNAKFEHCEDRGYEGVGCGEWVSPPTGEGVWGCVAPQKKIFDLGSYIGQFWCKLSAFCTVRVA